LVASCKQELRDGTSDQGHHCGSFASIGELVRDIEAYLSDRNATPKPYTWKAEGAAILEKINRARRPR
jgi:hypothetical protein